MRLSLLKPLLFVAAILTVLASPCAYAGPDALPTDTALPASIIPAASASVPVISDADLPMRTFSQRDGIDSSYIFGMAQDPAGYLYALTLRALYFFSGQRFYEVALSDDSGRPAYADALRFLPDGRLLVLRDGVLRVSREATSARLSPLSIQFDVLKTTNLSRVRNVFVEGNGIFAIDAKGAHRCSLEKRLSLVCQLHTVPAGVKQQAQQIDGHLFFRDASKNRINDAEGNYRFSLPVDAVVPTALANHGDRSLFAYTGRYLLVPAADGRVQALPLAWKYDRETIADRPTFVTGSVDARAFFDGSHLQTYESGYWSFPNHELAREQDIFFAFVDKDRQFWTARDSVDLTKLIGWGIWENLEPQSIRAVWSVLPGDKAQMLFTDQGIYPLRQNQVGERLIEGNFFFGLQDGKGGYWAPVDDQFLLHCDWRTQRLICDQKLPVRRVMGLAASAGHDLLWIASDEGLFELARGDKTVPVLAQDAQGRPLDQPSGAIALRNGGTPWAAVGDGLYRRDDSGKWVQAVSHWPNARQFSPMAMTFSSPDDLWIGGLRAKSGLLHLILDGSRVKRIEQIDAACTGSPIIFSLLADSKKRLWVGTENGLAAYDGRQWVRLTKDDGLISANINQQGLTEDRDGTIWITTTRGVSHLMHPEHFFEKNSLSPVFVQVRLGDRLLPQHAVPFSRDPLMVTLGSLNTALASTTYFRYRLEGIDSEWITTTTGEIRYNFVPPGHSRLIVQAINDNRNLVSEPVILEIRMQRPWWAAWPLISLYVISVVALPVAMNRIRFRYLLKRQKRLESLVDERTEEMRAAQKALEQQARQDGLTRLMNRRTAEASAKRLLEKLAQPDYDGAHKSATLALFDVDYFKAINDTFGHTIGDEILAGIGSRLLRDKKPDEIIGRYGGEEFLIVIHGDFALTRQRITLLLAALSDVPFETKIGALSIGCSAGVARTNPGEVWGDTLERADQALYQAKMEGRGRMIVSERDRDDEGYRG